MLRAQLRGKVSVDQERAEDILTSNVFGTLAYVPFRDGLAPVLSRAVGDSAAEFQALLASTEATELAFWPWLEEWTGHGCEPDILLSLRTTGQLCGLVLIEAKYRSGKSSVADPCATPGCPPRDQLAREWVNVKRLAETFRIPAFALFVTADVALPAAALRETQDDLARCGLPPAELLWLSWFDIARQLDRRHAMLNDLRDLLEQRYEFRWFDGLKLAGCRLTWSWEQPMPPVTAVISPWEITPLTWSFAHGRQ